MLAYRKSDFAAYLLADESTSSPKNGTTFYSPNIFIRIGLFLFGSLCAGAALGILFLVMGADSKVGLGTILLFFSAIMILFLEGLIRKAKPFFRAGLDEALLYGALWSFTMGLFLILGLSSHPHFGLVIFFTVLYAFAALRYADSQLALSAFILGLVACFDLGRTLGYPAKIALLPTFILVSISVIVFTNWALSKKTWFYWDHLWRTLKFAALLTAYGSGNYFVVREFGRELFGFKLGIELNFIFIFTFYIYTFGLPTMYITFGLIRKDRLSLHGGLLTLALTAATYKYYHPFIPIEMGLTIGGIALIGFAWIALRTFSTERFAITSNAIPSKNKEGLLDLEGAALSHLSPTLRLGTSSEGMQGKGGGFGGGGASGQFQS